MAGTQSGSTTTARPGPVYVDEAEEHRLLDLGGGMIRSQTRAAIRLSLYLSLTFALIPVQAVAVLLRLRLAERLPRFYHRLCTRILGIRVVVRGRRVRERPVLFVANHVSYLDITALGSVVTGCFIAKSEVAGWPLFGLLAKLQRTVFIARKRTAVARHGDDIADRLEAGDNLILFPEGTSGDGTRVLPFKSAFFAVAERRPGGRPLTVQPVSIAYTRLNEVPLGRGLRPFFAWYGDMELAPHLWTVAALGQLTVDVEFHPPITVDEAGSRKALATKVRAQVAGGLARANAGR
jgi:1-acyl-sn-glycerol-3-phosphate acyltransferase